MCGSYIFCCRFGELLTVKLLKNQQEGWDYGINKQLLCFLRKLIYSNILLCGKTFLYIQVNMFHLIIIPYWTLLYCPCVTRRTERWVIAYSQDIYNASQQQQRLITSADKQKPPQSIHQGYCVCCFLFSGQPCNFIQKLLLFQMINIDIHIHNTCLQLINTSLLNYFPKSTMWVLP